METNWIQRYALVVLLRNKSARVKDLSPPDMPANLFAYHLDALRTAGYIQKTSRGIYELTAEGEAFAGTFSTETLRSVKEVKTVMMFYGKKGEEYLLFKWSRQPYLGQVTLPYDRLAFEQSLPTGLEKAMKEKLGVSTEAKYKMSVMVKIVHDGMTISHMNALVYEVDVDAVAVPFESRNGELILQKLTDGQYMNGLPEFIGVIERGEAVAEVELSY